MIRLFNIEMRKLMPYTTFWVLIGLYMILLFLIFYGVGGQTITWSNYKFNMRSLELYKFPNIWHNLTYLASYFHLILGVIVVTLACNEINYNTIRLQLINGMRRRAFLMGKVLVILLVAGGVTLFVGLTGLIVGLEATKAPSLDKVLTNIKFLPVFFVQAVGYMSFALLAGIWLRRTGISIGLFLLYTYVIEPLIAFNISDKSGGYLPMKLFASLIHNPFGGFLGENIPDTLFDIKFYLSFAYIAVLLILSYWLVWRRDW